MRRFTFNLAFVIHRFRIRMAECRHYTAPRSDNRTNGANLSSRFTKLVS